MTEEQIVAALSAAEQSAPAEALGKLRNAYAGLVDLAAIVRQTGRGGTRAELERRMTAPRAAVARPAAPRASTPATTRPVSRETQRALDAHARYKEAAWQDAVNQRWLAAWNAPEAVRERLTRLVEAFKDSPREEVRADLRYRLATFDRTGVDPGAARPDDDDRAAARLFGMHPQTVAVWSRLAAAGGARCTPPS